MPNIKQIVKERNEDFKRIRKNIKEESKCSWTEATNYAYEAFDAMYGTYDTFEKINVNNIEQLIIKIKNEHSQYMKIIAEFLNRECQFTNTLPTMIISIIYKKKENIISINDRKEDLEDSIQKIKNLTNNKKIIEVYYGEEYSYGSWCHPEWTKFEIYLK